MRILVTYPLHPNLIQPGLGDLVVYRPEIAGQGEEALRQALSEHPPDALLVNGNCPGPATLAAWRERASRPVQLVCSHGGEAIQGLNLPGVGVHQLSGAPGRPAEDLEALAVAERRVMEEATARRLAPLGISTGGERGT